MRAWANYHSHTNFCDGSDEAVNYVEEAIKLGLPAYGFSSHAPVPFSATWCIPDDKFADYLQEVRRIKQEYSGKIEIYVSLEVDFIPGIAGRHRHLLKNTVLDYFIGSVHFVDSFEDGTPWGIDTSYDLFKRGYKEIFQYDFRKVATRYFELTRQMIEEDKPTIVGHMDKIKMFNRQGNFFSEFESWYKDQIRLTIEALKRQNCIVEINTRGFYRYNQPDLYPGEWTIEQLVNSGIPLMINSDSHKPEEISKGMEYAAGKMKNLGVTEVFCLINERWKPYPFNDKGILFG
ncbi:MAG TPA: histidinol-phosphatase HisJ [Draconibacterium sp.]|nr:histidinol-phosphatase HisJ [Draconibacterium sp.]